MNATNERRWPSHSAGTAAGARGLEGDVLIDCTVCDIRGAACGGCMVTALLEPEVFVEVADDVERRAVDVLVAGGVVAPIRVVAAVDDAGDRSAVRSATGHASLPRRSSAPPSAVRQAKISHRAG